MTQSMLPAEIVISIIFGILQLIVGLVSLWQQHYFRWAARKSWITVFNHKKLTRQELADVEDHAALRGVVVRGRGGGCGDRVVACR